MATRANAMTSSAGAGEGAEYEAPDFLDQKPEKLVAEDYVPEGFKDQQEYLEDARETYIEDRQADQKNIDAGMDDLKFIAVDQWDPEVRAAREAAGRPVISINTLPQFIGQVIGDRRMNRTTVKVRPLKDATMADAEARAGIIKGIEAHSRAERVYDAALEDQVSCGIGNFRVVMDYANNDIFLQDIFIRQIPNPFAVTWDRFAFDPTGRDAHHCFVEDNMPKRVFERSFPDARPMDEMAAELPTLGYGWFDNNAAKVTEHWRMMQRPRMFAMGAQGQTLDITDWPREKVMMALMEGHLWRDPTGQPRMRPGDRTYAQMHLITGTDILAGPYELPLDRLPIIRVNGREARVGDERIRYSLVRWSKDACRMRNYWRSVAVEKLALAPKSMWLAEKGAVEGFEDDYRDAHLSGDPLLRYKDGKQAPVRIGPPPTDAAILTEVQMNNQDIKDTTGLHDASLGIRSNEVSGRAIMARQAEGDVAVVIYHDNLNNAIQEGGSVVNQLLPVAYDTVRTLKVIGEDDREKEVEVNNPNNPESIDLSAGKYDVYIATGPSFTTQRQEAAMAMLETIKVAPQFAEIAGDLIVEAQDWPGAQKIAERLKKAMPKELTGEEEQMTPEQQQTAMQEQQAAAEEAAEVKQLQKTAAQAEVAEKVAKAEQARYDATRARAQAEEAEANAEIAEINAEFAPTIKAAEVLRAGQSSQPAQPSQRGDGPRPAARPSGGNRPAQPRKGKSK